MSSRPVPAVFSALRRALVGPDFPPTRPLVRAPRLAPYAAPLGLLVLVGLFAIALAEERDRALPAAAAGLFSALTVAPLAVLWPRPLLAWRLTMLTLLTCTFNAPPGQPWPWNPLLVLVALLVLAVVALRVDWALLPWIGGITLLSVMIFVNGTDVGGVIVLVVVLLILGGLARRNRLSGVALARQTELGELEKARRAVLEERTRIARELHDVVAHHMSMIAVQAETAPYRLGALTEPARTEFTAMAGSAREALTDMRRLLGVLRSDPATPETAPQPGLADLPELVAAARRAGMTVTVTGPRHAPGAVIRLTVRPGDRALWIGVENDHPPARAAAADPAGPVGHGLTGMRERAALLGGRFTAGPTPDGFQVTARLPYHLEDADV